MNAAYYEIKSRIMGLAEAFYGGDDYSRNVMGSFADFYPRLGKDGGFSEPRSMMIRINGEIFLVEDTSGGETGVFSLLLPIM